MKDSHDTVVAAGHRRFLLLVILLAGILGTTADAHGYYHPTLGCFVQRDPIGYADGMNLYEYVRSSPVTGTDPSGYSIEPENVVGPDDVMRRTDKYIRKADSDWLLSLIVPEEDGTILTAAKRQFAYNEYALIRLGLGFNPGGRGTSTNNQFVYTCKYGWIDFGHYYISAAIGYAITPERAYAVGIGMEKWQQFWKDMGVRDEWAKSAYTKEDLMSNWQGTRLADRMRKSTVAFAPANMLAAGAFDAYDIGKDTAKFLNEAEAIDPAAGGGIAGVLLRIDAATSAYWGHVRDAGPPPKPGRSIFHHCFCRGKTARTWAKAKPVASKSVRAKIWTKPLKVKLFGKTILIRPRK